ncbi:MAG: acetate--CoA ligase family protein [Candidatus Aminicenantes bacterium]|nr:acetate--CoA ligase family protein [Candidatus Aminicenantes bacterium]
MARLFEYQSKELLKQAGIRIPWGGIASSPEEAAEIAKKLGQPIVLKIQVWVTGRASLGGIRFATTPEEASQLASELLGLKIKNFVVDKILVEEKLEISRELFAGLVIDDALKKPVLIFSSVGGRGVEEIASHYPEKIIRHEIDVRKGLEAAEALAIAHQAGFSDSIQKEIAEFLIKLVEIARKYEARSLEVNPLVITTANELVAADAHMVIDDYAVFRHPELGIEVAREFDRPPTELEKIAYKVEEKDYRGTFYFFQMIEDIPKEEIVVGFHGAGGGGSMMSMDALLRQGFRPANYCDTSGNPPASKVYRAAKIILSQPGLIGYFASGSGVASQEQYHSARGLVKAFLEEKLEIPAVIRLGGNFEELAIEILQTYLKEIPAKVEGYGRAQSPDFCALRLKQLIEEKPGVRHKVRPMEEPLIPADAYIFSTMTGSIWIDDRQCETCSDRPCLEACSSKILGLVEGKIRLVISPEEAQKGKCTECLACEIACRFHGHGGLGIILPIPGLKEYRQKIIETEKQINNQSYR